MPRKRENWSTVDPAPVHDLATADDSPEEKKTLYIRVAAPAHRAIKSVAAERGLSLEGWVRDALNQALVAEGRDPLA